MLLSQPRRMSLPHLISDMGRYVRLMILILTMFNLGVSFSYFFFVCFGLPAVWRHVLGTKDAIDGVDIALGKCKESFLDIPNTVFAFTLIYHCVCFFQMLLPFHQKEVW